MSTPIRTRIFNAVVARFEGITVAGGYVNDLAEAVYPWKRGPFAAPDEAVPTDGEWGVALADVKETVNPMLGQVWDCTLELKLQAVCRGGADPVADARLLICDLQRAIGTDPKWGGLAIDTRWEAAEIGQGENEQQVAIVNVDIKIMYKQTAWDGYNQP